MTKKEAIKALIDALVGEEDVEVNGDTTAELISFLASCLSVDSGAVKFAVPEEG